MFKYPDSPLFYASFPTRRMRIKFMVYGILHRSLFPLVPRRWRWGVQKRFRLWMTGPDHWSNFDQLNKLLENIPKPE